MRNFNFKLLTGAAALLVSGLLATSCNENILNIAPVANNTVDQYYQTEAQMNQAVAAIYNGLLTLPSSVHWNMSEIRSDNILTSNVNNAQRDYTDISNFTASSQTVQFQTTWSDLFQVVFRANLVQEKIQPFTFARVNQFKGEARFLRALAYFDLVRLWGAVPISSTVLTAEQAQQVPRAPIADVYKFIIDDLKFAADNLPASYGTGEKGRATKWAAKGLLGKVYLTMYGFPLRDASALPLAKQQLADVYAAESATTFSMATSFPDLFKTANDNRYALFEVQYVSGGTGLGSSVPWEQGATFPAWWSPFTAAGPSGAVPQAFLGTNWPRRDTRRNATIDTIIRNPTTGALTGGPQFTKFLEKGTTAPVNNRDYSNNFPILRFEDVMLMYAEVLNEESTVPPLAVTIVNRIRTRSGLAAFTATSPERASQAAFRAAILKERRYELIVEGQRWFDLVRTGTALQTIMAFKQSTGISLGRTLDSHDLLYPIPLLELTINPGFWQQNPGYN
jgi:hypothetical protein